MKKTSNVFAIVFVLMAIVGFGLPQETNMRGFEIAIVSVGFLCLLTKILSGNKANLWVHTTIGGLSLIGLLFVIL
jgi:hypothetical protein